MTERSSLRLKATPTQERLPQIFNFQSTTKTADKYPIVNSGFAGLGIRALTGWLLYQVQNFPC